MAAGRPTRRGRLLRTAVVAVAVGAGLVALVRGVTSQPSRSAAAAAAPAAPATAGGQAVDAALFAPGSCLALPPTRAPRHRTVFLDAGHGGPDPGGTGATQAGAAIDERSLTLPVVLDTAALLRAEGYGVVVSRSTNSSVVALTPADTTGGVYTLTGAHADTAARALCANLAHAAVLVSVHFNVGSSPADAGTLTTYDAARPFAAANKELATLLQADMVAALRAVPGWDVPDDGVVTDDTVGNALTAAAAAYGHLLVLGPARPGFFTTPSAMPGALIEPLFLTDPFEGTVAASAQGQQVMAHAIALAVTTFLSRTPA